MGVGREIDDSTFRAVSGLYQSVVQVSEYKEAELE
jgi:hypothetical protein